ncbi:MAG: thiaminase II/PqqC family protein [Acidimicrobiales bacterium]
MLDDLFGNVVPHPFVEAVGNGTISDSAFDRWLGQDAHFVADLLSFQARLLARAPRPAQEVLAAGCVALVEELEFFDLQADQRGLELPETVLPATARYAELLRRLDTGPYDAAITGLWVIERAYLLAWASVAPGKARFAVFVDHWTTPGFVGYVDALRELATPEKHEDLVREVLVEEVEFWDMALG